MTELIDNKQQRLDKLLQAIVQDVEKFLSRRKKVEFYAFAFDCSVYYGEILWAFNSEKGFANTLKYYQKEYPEDDYADKNSVHYLDLKYGIGDWAYNTQSPAYYIWGDSDAGCAAFDQLDDEQSDKLHDEVMDFFAKLLLAFCQTSTFQAINKTADFKVLLSDHDDNTIDDTMPRSEKLMQRLNRHLAQKLNAKFPKISKEKKSRLLEIDQQLIDAVKNKQNNQVKQLVAAGANVNVFDNEKQTPLYIAAEQGNFECVQYLLEHGADVNAMSGEYVPCSALSIAAYQGHFDIMHFLLEHGANTQNENTLLLSSVRNGNLEIVRLLLEHGANPNVLNLQIAATPLIYALIHQPNNQALIKMLLDYGADPNLSNNAVGTTPIMIAAYKGQPENVQLLIDANADVNATEQDGSTALMWILTWLKNEEADQKRLSCARLLLEHGADVNAVDSRGKTVLAQTPAKSKHYFAEVLLEYGAKK